jgi:hypothetical protein
MSKVPYRYLPSIIGRMLAENAKDFSDGEIERTLSQCVLGNKLVGIAKKLRDSGAFQSYLSEVYPNVLRIGPAENGVEAWSRIVRLVIAATKGGE